MVEACAEAELDELRSRLRDCDGQMVGVVVDESTANNNNQYLVIGIVWVEKCVKREAFLALRKVHPATGKVIADTIVEELKKIMPEDWDLATHLVSLGCDGASVMLGNIKGVSGILRDQAPYGTSFHCAAHRVSLVCRVFDLLRVYASIEECMKACYALFCRSPLACESFKAVQQLFEKQGRLLTLHDIRWLSIFPVLERWLKQYDPLLVFVAGKSELDVSYRRVHEALLDGLVMLGSRALFPLLEQLHTIVKLIQRTEFTFEDLGGSLTRFETYIDRYYNPDLKDAFADASFRDFIKVDSVHSPLFWDAGTLKYRSPGLDDVDHYVTYKGEHVNHESWPELMSEIYHDVSTLAEEVGQEMQNRFPPTELLDAFSVLQLSYWKKAGLSGEVPPCFTAKVDFLGKRYGRSAYNNRWWNCFPHC